ncbi:MAG TPA: phosphopantetheine-binding protein [Candidatus Baltobacteraceae bacterium]|nr:phosphopantetheine-binding protein [Candidatus Baltobacteraceae bacterium]
MIPHRIVMCKELPLTPSGKVDRVALANAGTAFSGRPTLSVVAFRSKRTETERAVAEIWRVALHCDDPPGLDENFFDAGGDSLRLLAVHSRLREQLGSEIGVTDLFEHCTIRRLASFIDSLAVRA